MPTYGEATCAMLELRKKKTREGWWGMEGDRERIRERDGWGKKE